MVERKMNIFVELPLIFLLAISLRLLPTANGIRCFCTEEHCVPYGVCEAEVCVVGILRANNGVIRTCGDEPLGCQHNVGKWNDVCACSESFCNTYLYLRENSNGGGTVRNRQPSDDDLVFQRMDRPDDFPHGFDDPSQYDPSTGSKTSLLTLLLVIVPLSVGAATVLVVSFNYYCHLC